MNNQRPLTLLYYDKSDSDEDSAQIQDPGTFQLHIYFKYVQQWLQGWCA